ncbi:MAG: hypothetical protein ACKN9V_08765 [Pseudomonadota bacterium]
MHLFALLLLSVGSFCFDFCLAERSHGRNEIGGRSSEVGLTQQLSFSLQFHQEIPMKGADPSQNLQIEYGGIPDTKNDKQRAIRVYRGQKGHPSGDFEQIAMQAGKARTLVAAKRACEKLVPLGQWRLVTVPEIMAFFVDLAPSFALPQNIKNKGILFWASSGNDKKDKENKETFFSIWEGEDPSLDERSFSSFQTTLRIAVARAKSQEEKQTYIETLKQTREGIPAICVIGSE